MNTSYDTTYDTIRSAVAIQSHLSASFHIQPQAIRKTARQALLDHRHTALERSGSHSCSVIENAPHRAATSLTPPDEAGESGLGGADDMRPVEEQVIRWY